MLNNSKVLGQATYTVQYCLQATSKLKGVSDSPRLDVELLLCHALQQSRSYLFTWPGKALSTVQIQLFEQMLQRRINGEPIAHILGEKEFWSLSLTVNNSTLIPRPETELLVETALEIAPNKELHLLDLGTGTGAIALALAMEKPTWQITATDKYPEAIELAKHNRDKLGLNNVEVVTSDWFENLGGKQFDLIVANPPYIAEDDPHLNEGDVRLEPRTALVAKNQGLADIEQIIDQSRRFLTNNGWLLLEHGFDQAQSVRDLFSNYGYQEINTREDLSKHPRVTLACYKGRNKSS